MMSPTERAFLILSFSALIAVLVFEHKRVNSPNTPDVPDDKLGVSVVPDHSSEWGTPAYLVVNLPLVRNEDFSLPRVTQ